MKALSLTLGTAFGLCAWVILRLYWPAEAWIAVPTGIGFTVLLYAALQMAELWESRRYERMEANKKNVIDFEREPVVEEA